jgi:tRNA G18 (ribose-2'-O)-methylase SpoU
VVGGEGPGSSDDVDRAMRDEVDDPMASTVESLNVAVAGGI